MRGQNSISPLGLFEHNSAACRGPNGRLFACQRASAASQPVEPVERETRAGAPRCPRQLGRQATGAPLPLLSCRLSWRPLGAGLSLPGGPILLTGWPFLTNKIDSLARISFLLPGLLVCRFQVANAQMRPHQHCLVIVQNGPLLADCGAPFPLAGRFAGSLAL